jgi:outer membrane lipoprotein LolB
VSPRHPPSRRQALRRSLLAIACTLLLAACTSPLVRDATPAAPRLPASAFAVEGRLSATDGREAASGRFEWVHDAEHDRLTLFSPLGQVVALLDGDPARCQPADRRWQPA